MNLPILGEGDTEATVDVSLAPVVCDGPQGEPVRAGKWIYTLRFPSGDSHESSGWYETAEDATVAAAELVEFFNLHGWL